MVLQIRVNNEAPKPGPELLEEHGLSWSLVKRALISGRAGFFEYTESDIPGARGMGTLTRVVSLLSESTKTGGLSEYIRIDDHGQVVFLRGQNVKERFVVMTGDSATGTAVQPCTMSPKGSMTSKKIDINIDLLGGQPSDMLLPASTGAFTSSVIPDDDYVYTWFLLFYIDGMTGTVRSEFSLADEYETMSDGKCQIRHYEKRIILPDISREDGLEKLIKPVDPTAYDNGFEVSRRNGSK
ncbi:hypothetical protein OZX67_06235 [Bifidobacterium sp. ESL0728]|uniref:hypothetical protein n=1 Tax=Bifidobacterium sp. ESL0728 TaxID=2983220 RepID=UPI0023F6FF2C|nr:hypothetical protein [Bifidobacterium sp. ESL0728]WEV58424.1 hypothetical protein OZX67_06235 [Bifidobacterium sp. ESL0728]